MHELPTTENPMTPSAIAALVASAEDHLQQHPYDAHCWDLLTPVYSQLGHHEDAAKARHNTLTLLATAIRNGTLDEVLKAYACLYAGEQITANTVASSAQ